jgi:hypothetical protein
MNRPVRNGAISCRVALAKASMLGGPENPEVRKVPTGPSRLCKGLQTSLQVGTGTFSRVSRLLPTSILSRSRCFTALWPSRPCQIQRSTRFTTLHSASPSYPITRSIPRQEPLCPAEVISPVLPPHSARAHVAMRLHARSAGSPPHACSSWRVARITNTSQPFPATWPTLERALSKRLMLPQWHGCPHTSGCRSLFTERASVPNTEGAPTQGTGPLPRPGTASRIHLESDGIEPSITVAGIQLAKYLPSIHHLCPQPDYLFESSSSTRTPLITRPPCAVSSPQLHLHPNGRAWLSGVPLRPSIKCPVTLGLVSWLPGLFTSHDALHLDQVSARPASLLLHSPSQSQIGEFISHHHNRKTLSLWPSHLRVLCFLLCLLAPPLSQALIRPTALVSYPRICPASLGTHPLEPACVPHTVQVHSWNKWPSGLARARERRAKNSQPTSAPPPSKQRRQPEPALPFLDSSCVGNMLAPGHGQLGQLSPACQIPGIVLAESRGYHAYRVPPGPRSSRQTPPRGCLQLIDWP